MADKMATTRIAPLSTKDNDCLNTIHLMPCNISYSGEANVTDYFENTITDSDSVDIGIYMFQHLVC